MTAAITQREDSTLDLGGAQVRAHSRQLATVVRVQGEIDVLNVDLVRSYVRRFVHGTNAVVLDLGEMGHFAPVGVGFLCRVDDDCRAAGVEWKLVASPAVIELLGDQAQAMFPITHTVHEALRNLADAIVSRRQMVLSLIGRPA